ncbi:MAG TPA: GNAT family N-acetyltransferase [Candidatus Saccharimonadales bacterium]|jgi:ribosomal protein S18 acetylase RimI-like enzyme|nr:GNAT family N-acetyltransferase [Candidatus Saccharimonadales bacterium]
MSLEFRKVRIPEELPALCEFDRRTFHEYPADLFSVETWEHLESWWLIADGEIVGCSAFLLHVDFDDTRSPGTLHIMTTGVLPEYRNRGYGKAQKEWQIEYAREHGFKRIVTNSRQSNTRMIALNQKYGFKIKGLDPEYYSDPLEAAVVMERKVRTAKSHGPRMNANKRE